MTLKEGDHVRIKTGTYAGSEGRITTIGIQQKEGIPGVPETLPGIPVGSVVVIVELVRFSYITTIDNVEKISN